MMFLLFMRPFSLAIFTVSPINKSNRLLSFKRNLRNFVNVLGSIISVSSRAISRKYLYDKSYLDRSTTPISDIPSITFNNKYLNNNIGSIAFLPLSGQYLFLTSS